jgi:hypothetical protein
MQNSYLGKPDAGNLHVRFDEEEGAKAPLYSTEKL